MSILMINQLVKRKGNTLLLPEINLEIVSGQCIVIQCNSELGHLLIELLLGTVPASSGQVLFEGDELRHEFKKKTHKIGISLLNDGVYDRLTVKDYFTFYKNLYETTTSIDEVLRRIGLLDHRNSKLSTLSFSEKKRLQLGRAIIHNPSFIILEEPEQNVDIESHIIIRTLIAELRDEGKAILITTSYLADAISITNEVYRLNEHELKKIEIIDEPETAHQEDNKLIVPDTGIDVSSETNIVTTHATHIDNDIDAAIDHTAEVESNQSTLTEQQIEQSEVSIQTEASAPVHIEVRPVRVEKIPAKVEDKIILFDPTEINFIESSDGLSMLHVKGETFPCMLTLNELEQKLKAFGFFRCHRSYIVNLQKVREVITWTRNSFSLILDDNKKSSIPLSKGKLDELKTILGI
ncbi:MAG: LytTR family transcriptional regulator DNA-binding domain-containing protein [Candidatus Pristimantibacillus lignocellulolyticus]|uniref:LytTR family transcriptional regulator DNA-binding domain-containing protein n=1 Tax=Candidatus Pristimantibacillus lignocellulolyticus TaxID=2994561 RepID=A0A9J6ZI82_9BACL|nr:MAG: LytTR family transcriptional regulator DNA-binding domain-containing protein [Candidatus Pristimantibacillus lignocellulolyticus]